MRWRWLLTTCTVVLMTSCSSPASPLLRGPAAADLLSIDQMISPDFVRDSGPAVLDANGVAAAGGATAGELRAAGLGSAAGEDFFRSSPVLAVLNGPAEVIDTVLEFSGVAGAASAYATDIRDLDARPGSVAVSTGSLGDAAHCATVSATSPDGTPAVEITVEWRVENLVDRLVVRGRMGGVRPDDALLLAHRQTVTELGLSPPTPG